MPQVVLHAHRIRFKPTTAQEDLLTRSFGAARWSWNVGLEMISRAWKERRERFTYVDVGKQLTVAKKWHEFDWLNEVPSDVVTQALRDLDTAYRNFFQKRARYPRFKKRDTKNTVRFMLDPRHAGKMANWAQGKLELPKLGVLNLSRALPNTASPKLVTVGLEPTGKWYVSFVVEEEVEMLAPVHNAVGVDLGVSCIAALSDGRRIENLRKLTGRLRHLKRMQRCLARRQKGSNRWKRQKQRIGRIHARVAGQRRDQAHRLTNRLITKNQIIAIEDLHVKGMMARGGGLAREISDVGFAEIRRQLEYKAAWRSRTVVAVDRFAPTSKTCSKCGHVLEKLALNIREWACPTCGTAHDRDVNAARVIKRLALRSLKRPAKGPVTARGDRSSGTGDSMPEPVPVGEARTGQTVRACLERARAV